MPREILATMEAEERVRSLLQIEVDYRNWSWLLDPNWPSTPPIVSGTREKVDSVPVAETIVEKDYPGASASRQGPKPSLETCEKRPHRADPCSKKVTPEPSVQPNDEEEAESALMHRKWKVFIQAGPQVGWLCTGISFFVMDLALT